MTENKSVKCLIFQRKVVVLVVLKIPPRHEYHTKGLEVDMKQEALNTFIDGGGFNRKIKLYIFAQTYKKISTRIM